MECSAAVVVPGRRQVGRRTIALNISESIPDVYLDLEDRTDLEKLRDVSAFNTENCEKLIIMDEVQRLPEVFAPLRGIIDKERRKGNKSG